MTPSPFIQSGDSKVINTQDDFNKFKNQSGLKLHYIDKTRQEVLKEVQKKDKTISNLEGSSKITAGIGGFTAALTVALWVAVGVGAIGLGAAVLAGPLGAAALGLFAVSALILYVRHKQLNQLGLKSESGRLASESAFTAFGVCMGTFFVALILIVLFSDKGGGGFDGGGSHYRGQHHRGGGLSLSDVILLNYALSPSHCCSSTRYVEYHHQYSEPEISKFKTNVVFQGDMISMKQSTNKDDKVEIIRYNLYPKIYG